MITVTDRYCGREVNRWHDHASRVRAPNRGRSPRKDGGEVWSGGSVRPSP